MMTPEQEKQAEEWLDRKHWAKDPCPEHPGHDESSCVHCGKAEVDLVYMTRTGPLDAQSRHEIKVQTGREIKDWSEYRTYLKDNNLEGGVSRGSADYERRKDMDAWVAAGGSSSGVPLPESCRVGKRRENPVDIKALYRQAKEQYGRREADED